MKTIIVAVVVLGLLVCSCSSETPASQVESVKSGVDFFIGPSQCHKVKVDTMDCIYCTPVTEWGLQTTALTCDWSMRPRTIEFIP